MLHKILKENYQDYISTIIDNRVSYKPNKIDFDLWLEYLNTHPVKPNYLDYEKFKEDK